MKLSLLLSIFFLSFFSSFSFGQCENFSNFPHGAEEGKKNYFYMRENIKKNNIAAAIPFWRKGMKYTPGGSQHFYTNGIKIYEYLIKKEKNEEKIAFLRDSLYTLFDNRIKCFAKSNKKKGSILLRKAYMMYKQKADNQWIYDTYQEGFMLSGDNVNSFLIYPYAFIAVERFKNEEINRAEAQKNYESLKKLITYNIENAKKEEAKFKYQDVLEKVEKVFHQKLEQPIFDCEYYSNIYIPQYKANPDSPAVYRMVYQELLKARCPATLPILVEIGEKDKIRIAEKKAAIFKAARDNAPKSKKAVWEYQKGNYSLAADLFSEGAVEEENLSIEARADVCFKAAQISFSHLKDYAKARRYAEQALEYRPNWGKPYLLIGDLYASSGPLCGTGTGFKSQVVTWVAIDMWKKAKQVDSDPFVKKRANKQINKYYKFMPTGEDLHLRQLKEGQTYTIPCWIQRKTKVRAYNEFKNP